MLITGKISQQKVKTDIIAFGGGLNEQVSNQEVSPGELIGCKNYIDQDGPYSGYQSIKGYEAYDGQTSPSSIAATSADDTAREAQRALIAKPTGASSILGLHIYNDELLAFRGDANPATETVMFKSSTAGWVEVASSTLNINGTYRCVNERFAEFQSNAEVMFFVDGVSHPHYYDGSAITEIDMESIVGAGVYPTHIGAWRNRLFLVYPGGHILFSEVGDPTAWDSSVGLAGELYIGDTVTNVVEAPGGVLIFFTRNRIEILHYGSTGDDFIFQKVEYSNEEGGITDSAEVLFGNIYFADTLGITEMIPIKEYGDFTTEFISKNVYQTFERERANIVTSVVDKSASRYYLIYTDSTTGQSSSLVFTFNKKKLKGICRTEYPIQFNCATEGTYSDGSTKMFVGGEDGMVYQLNSGTSFNGAAIQTEMRTPFYGYKSPRHWKHFQRLQFEVDCPQVTTFTVASYFDYFFDRTSQQSTTHTMTSSPTSAKWGTAVWGAFRWGDAYINQGSIIYPYGYGVNMGMQLNTSSAYNSPHTIYNVTSDYIVGQIKQ